MTDYPVEIRQQDRKSLVMKVTPDGIVALIPMDVDPQGSHFRAFLEQGLAKLRLASPALGVEPLTTSDVSALVNEWAQRIDVPAGRIQVRTMRRKWASCSSRGTLTLSEDVQQLPHRLAEYVVVHELVHLRVPDHGKGFRALMNIYMPDWRERELELAVFATRQS